MVEENKFIVKERDSPHGVVLIITDSNIRGKKFENETLQLDLSKEFYKGTEMTKEEIAKKINKSYILHLTGENTINLIRELKVVNEIKIITIEKVPHAEIYLGS